MKVTDPGGQVWRVSRRWVPWRRRLRSIDDLNLDGGGNVPDTIDDLVIGLILIIVVIVLAVLAPFLLVGFFAAFELVFLFLLLPVAVLGRVVLGRGWHVELRRGFRPWTETEAGTWQASSVAIHQLAEAVRRGEIPGRTIPAVRWGRVADEGRRKTRH